MQGMRRLAHLFVEFKRQCTAVHIDEPASAADLLAASHFEMLRKAIEVYTTASSADVKVGLKKQVFYLLTKFVDFMKITYSIEDSQAKVKEVEDFIELLRVNTKDIIR